jgi:type VI secretion system VasD/TssJ family lipoprotein
MPRLGVVVAMVVLSALAACGGPKPQAPSQFTNPATSPTTMQWSFQPKAINLKLVSDPALNTYDGSPHTLVLCVYQLSAPASFQQMAITVPGVSKLLECANYDPSVISAQRIIVQPGQNQNLSLDRNENAKYVALAAGYYELNLGSATRLYEIPLLTTTQGMVFKDTYYQPAVLSRDVMLGPIGLQTMGGGK